MNIKWFIIISLYFQLKNFTTCALYNSTTKAWTVATENITSGSEAIHFLSKLTGMRYRCKQALYPQLYSNYNFCTVP